MGGGASTETFFGGRQAATLLTKASWWLGGIFLGLSLILAGLSSRGAQPRSVLEGQIQAPAPVNVQPLPLDVEPAPAGTQPTPPPNNQ
jgi:preprotein translocase subunit SecG